MLLTALQYPTLQRPDRVVVCRAPHQKVAPPHNSCPASTAPVFIRKLAVRTAPLVRGRAWRGTYVVWRKRTGRPRKLPKVFHRPCASRARQKVPRYCAASDLWSTPRPEVVTPGALEGYLVFPREPLSFSTCLACTEYARTPSRKCTRIGCQAQRHSCQFCGTANSNILPSTGNNFSVPSALDSYSRCEKSSAKTYPHCSRPSAQCCYSVANVASPFDRRNWQGGKPDTFLRLQEAHPSEQHKISTALDR